MKTWFQKFWEQHGERHIFMAESSTLAIGFIIAAIMYEPLKDLKAPGMTILIGNAMLLYNKIRSPKDEVKKPNGDQ